MQKKANPASAITLLRNYWKSDLQAGFSVSLIALPLCLGIAIASGFPPVAGLFAAIIGGLLVSRINGSHVTITGPAAGLIVVNLAAVETLGGGDKAVGYPFALAAIFVAGLIIIGLGQLKAGKLGDFFPSSVVHGMLAAIGVIIMVKQLFVGLGVSAHGHEFYEILADIPNSIRHANPEVVIITLVSLAILIVHPKIRSKYVKMVPAPIWVLAVAIPLEFLLDFEHEHTYMISGEVHKVGPGLLVHLPDNIMSAVVLPDFGKIGYGAFWMSAVTIALVTAIESVLSAIAVDSLDPLKRKTNLNKDLTGLGAGASMSSAIGGLPMISEIVRSSANVNNGAKSQWSNFFHAGFLLIFVLVGAPVIDHIPLAALAAMLIFTGFRLASPKEFKHVYEIGKSELVIFLFTLIVVLATDLLIGIAAGILLNMIMVMLKGVSFGSLFRVSVKQTEKKGVVHLEISGPVTFSNYLGLKKHLTKNASKSIIVLDLAKATMIDHSAMHHIHSIAHDREREGKQLQMINDSHLHPVSEHPLAERRSNAKVLEVKLSVRDQALQKLAAEKSWKYNPGSDIADRWAEFSAFSKTRLIREKNILQFDVDKHPVLIADVIIEPHGAVDRLEATVLVLTSKRHSLPVFTLEKEQSFDRVMEKLGRNDIDFEAFPEFSREYFLNGENENEIRSFFTPELIQFLEIHKGYQVQSNGKALIVFKGMVPAGPDEISEMVTIAGAFAKQEAAVRIK